MPSRTMTSSVEVKCAAAVTLPVAGFTRSKPGAVSTETSSVPSPTGAAPTGRPSPVTTGLGGPLNGGSGTVSRVPPAASGSSSLPGSIPRPSTPRPLDVSRTHTLLAPVLMLKTTTWLLCWLASAILDADSCTMPSGFCRSAKTCTTVPAGLSSVSLLRRTVLTQTLPLLATMTSSAPRTWANSGSEPKLRGAGHPAGPSGPVRAAAATTPGAALDIADNASPAKASKTTARSRPCVTILTTPPAPIDDPSGPATPGPAGHGHAEPSPATPTPAEKELPKTAAGHPAETANPAVDARPAGG